MSQESDTFDTIEAVVPPLPIKELERIEVNKISTDSSSSQKKNPMSAPTLFLTEEKANVLKQYEPTDFAMLKERKHTSEFVKPSKPKSLHSSQNSQHTSSGDEQLQLKQPKAMLSDSMLKKDVQLLEENDKQQYDSISEIPTIAHNDDLEIGKQTSDLLNGQKGKTTSSLPLVDNKGSEEVEIVDIGNHDSLSTPFSSQDIKSTPEFTLGMKKLGIEKKKRVTRVSELNQDSSKSKKNIAQEEYDERELSYVSSMIKEDEKSFVESVMEEENKKSPKENKKEKMSQKVNWMSQKLSKITQSTNLKPSQKKMNLDMSDLKSGSQKRDTQYTSSDELKQNEDDKKINKDEVLPIKYEESSVSLQSVEVVDNLAALTKGKKKEENKQIVKMEESSEALVQETKDRKDGNNIREKRMKEKENNNEKHKNIIGELKETINSLDKKLNTVVKKEETDDEHNKIFMEMSQKVSSGVSVNPSQLKVVSTSKSVDKKMEEEIMEEKIVDKDALRKSLSQLDNILSNEKIDFAEEEGFAAMPLDDIDIKEEINKDEEKKPKIKEIEERKENKKETKGKKKGIIEREKELLKDDKNNNKGLSGTKQMRKSLLKKEDKENNVISKTMKDIKNEILGKKDKKLEDKMKNEKDVILRDEKKNHESNGLSGISDIVGSQIKSTPEWEEKPVEKWKKTESTETKESKENLERKSLKKEGEKKFKTQEDTSTSKLKSSFSPYNPTQTQKISQKETKEKKEKKGKNVKRRAIKVEDEKKYEKILKVISASAEEGEEFYEVESDERNEITKVVQGRSEESFVDQYNIARRVLRYKNSKGRKRTYPVWRRVSYDQFTWGMSIDDFPELKREEEQWEEHFYDESYE